jgi:hypothetical protein
MLLTKVLLEKSPSRSQCPPSAVTPLVGVMFIVDVCCLKTPFAVTPTTSITSALSTFY